MVGFLLFLIPLLGLVAFLAWYFSHIQSRRRRALEVAAWLQAGLGTRGKVLNTRWLGPNDLFAPLEIDGQRVYGASAHARVGIRDIPDHLTLRCDLDVPPRFAAQVFSERWTLVPADAPPGVGDVSRAQTHRLGVYAITSGPHVVQNYREMMRSIINSQPLHVERLLLSPESPHLEISLNLNFVSPPPPAPLFRLLKRLAEAIPQHSRWLKN